MNVGLPGTGMGGVFYLLTALLMPVWELIRTLRTGRIDAARWRVAGAQAALAAGILAGMWATAWVALRLLPESTKLTLMALSRRPTDVFGVLPAALTFLTLAGLLITVEVWSYLSRPRSDT